MTKVRLLTLTAILISWVTSNAQKVDEPTARNIGIDFLANKKSPSSSAADRMPAKDSYELAYTATKEGKDCYFVFNCKSGGFVIVSADDRTSNPILGYSTSGFFNSSKMGINVKGWLDSYADQILALDTIHERLRAVKVAASSVQERHFIEPLVKVNWGQGMPYDKMCPKDYYGQQCITGCVATAMAQVIYTLQYPLKANAVNAYTSTRGINVPSLPPTTFDWDNSSEDEIAKLMRYCGQSVMMDYGVASSGADMYVAEEALQNTFGYSVHTSLIEHGNYDENQWSELLFSELSSGRPLIYAGRGTGGHAFVVDGYDDAEDLFHFNWGWDGDCDGYYHLSRLVPNSDNDYSDEQMAIVGMLPPATKISDATSVNIYSLYCDRLNISNDDKADVYTFNCGKWKVESDLKQEDGIEVGLGLYDGNDQFIKTLTYQWIDLFNNWLYHDYEPSVDIEKSLPPGEYGIYLVNRTDESSPWRKSSGSDRFYVSISLNSNGIEIKPIPQYDNYSSRHRDFGKVKIGDYYYHLFFDYRYYANLTAGETPFSGDLYIPDYVEYNGDCFTVLGIEDMWLVDYPDLKSVSLGMRDCPYIHYAYINRLEIREGVAKAYQIHKCHNISELTYPCSCMELMAPSYCDNLKKIAIKYSGIAKIKMGKDDWSEKSMPQLRDIYFYSEYPPQIIIESDDEITTNSKVIIHIPKGSKPAYLHSKLKHWLLVDDLPGVSENMVEIDYIGEDEDSAGFGPYIKYDNCAIEFGIRIPSENLKPYIGSSITGIKYFTTPVLYNDDFMENAEYVFLTDEENDYLVKKECVTQRGQWTEVKFESPYPISNNLPDLYVGIGRPNVLLQLYANTNYVWDGAYKRVMPIDSEEDYGIEYGKWDKEYPISMDPGCTFRIKAIVEGDNFPTDIVISYEIPTCIDNKLHVRLHSRTLDVVNSVTIAMTIDEKLYPEQTVATSLITNHDQYVDLELPKDITAGYHDLRLQVISVNGLADEIDSNSNRSGTVLLNIDGNGHIESLITPDGEPFDVYDLNGIMVKARTNDISDLPDGIFIIKGQKFVINK